ncbi:MAG: histidine phosphatase family protein, partial [Dechloromonas sp.]|nr:histidine phosphatase family protein [Dechloromonas sp.]
MKLSAQTFKHLWLVLALAAGTALAETPVLDIYLARHGQTDWNLEKRLQGGTDNPLNETGRQQAKQLGDKLAGVPITAVYS